MKHRAKTKNIASAVMKISKDLHVVEEVQESLSLFSNLLKDDAQLRSFLQSKRFSFDQKSEVIHSGLKDLIHPIIQELIIMHINENPIRFFRDFSFHFSSLLKEELNIARVIAHTADELSDEETDNLKQQIEKIIGKNTKLSTEFDPVLIGGLKLRIDNIFIDASIKTKMENLRKDLLQ